MDTSDELRRARRAAQPPPGAALLRLPAHQARALLPTATAPQDAAALEREGGIVGALLHAALRRFRELYSGGGRLALPQSILAQMLLYNALLHRARRVGSPPSADFLLRLLLRLPARHVARLLPPPAAHPERPSLLPFLLYAGLRRLRGRSLHGDEDDNALLVLLRVALGRVCAACVPRIIFAQGQGLRFALLHRARRVGPPPSGPYVLRLLLRLPAHEARRLLRRPTERTLRGPTLVRLLLYAGLRRLQATIQPGSDGLYREYVQVLGAVVPQLPRPSPPPPGGLLSTALAVIRRAFHRDEDDVDILEMILRVALPRLGTGLRAAY